MTEGFTPSATDVADWTENVVVGAVLGARQGWHNLLSIEYLWNAGLCWQAPKILPLVLVLIMSLASCHASVTSFIGGQLDETLS